MKNEKLEAAASALGWFGAYILLSLLSSRLPDALDCAVTTAALWGLIFVCSKSSEEGVLAYGGIRRVPPLWLMSAFCAGAGLNLAVSSLLPLLPLPEGIIDAYAAASSQYAEPSDALMLKTVLLVPVLEETVFRGLICERLDRLAPSRLAAFAAALIFASLHSGILWAAYAFVSGLLLCEIYLSCRSTLPCIALHIAFNASNYLWRMLPPLLDERGSHILGLALGASLCAVFTTTLFISFKKHL